MARLKTVYNSEVAPALMKKFEYKSPMQIPRLDKIVLNIGAGDAKENAKVIDTIIADLTLITGQKAVPTYAKKSVANFKLRAGQKIGAKVTLRGDRMYEFIDRLFNLSLWQCSGSSTSHSPVSVTSRVSIPTASTDVVTTLSDLRNSLYSPRSSTIR